MKFKTPAEIAAFFSCTPEQAKAHMRLNVAQLREAGEKARRAPTGVYRGYAADEWFTRAAGMEAAINR